MKHYISSILVIMYRYHWILLVIMIDKSAVYIMDSLRKPRASYANLIVLLQRAWTRFRRKQQGEFKEELDIKPEFPVCILYYPNSHVISTNTTIISIT